MVWRKVSVVDERREFVMFASQEGANVSALCRHYGVSRQTGYKWLGRGACPDESFADRSRRPLHQPARSPESLEAAVLEVRDEHPAWGARKIARSLEMKGVRAPAPSTVHAILGRHGRIGDGPRAHQAPFGRFERALPNQLWQMDFKGKVKMSGGGWCHPLTVLDDHSRFCPALEPCADEQGGTVKPLLERAFRRYGLPDAVYVDNGSPWGTGSPGGWTRFGVWLLKLGIEVIHGRPYHPQGRGKIERFHGSLAAESLSPVPAGGLETFKTRFERWRSVYNMERPHEALDLAVPASRYRPSARSFPEREPEMVYDEGEILRKVGTTKAYVSYAGRLWKVPQAFMGERVAIRALDSEGRHAICFGSTPIATIDLTEQAGKENRSVNHVSEHLSAMSPV